MEENKKALKDEDLDLISGGVTNVNVDELRVHVRQHLVETLESSDATEPMGLRGDIVSRR